MSLSGQFLTFWGFVLPSKLRELHPKRRRWMSEELNPQQHCDVLLKPHKWAHLKHETLNTITRIFHLLLVLVNLGRYKTRTEWVTISDMKFMLLNAKHVWLNRTKVSDICMNSLTKLAGTKFGLQEQEFRQPLWYSTTGTSQTYDEVHTEWNKKQRATVEK